MFLTSRETVGTRKPSPNGTSYANLTKVNATDQTMIVLESQLHIVVSDQYNSSQITCFNTGSGTNVSINVNVGKTIMIKAIASYYIVCIMPEYTEYIRFSS